MRKNVLALSIWRALIAQWQQGCLGVGLDGSFRPNRFSPASNRLVFGRIAYSEGKRRRGVPREVALVGKLSFTEAAPLSKTGLEGYDKKYEKTYWLSASGARRSPSGNRAVWASVSTARSDLIDFPPFPTNWFSAASLI